MKLRFDETIFLILIVIFVLVCFLMLQDFVYQHETLHEVNAKRHQCLETEITYEGLLGGQMTCLERTPYFNAEVAKQESDLNFIHETVSYNSREIMITFMLCTLFLSIILWVTKK